ncbi:hypothetical protein Pcinc_010449 [Petrolisthes cinctipes]|uniref:Uncharacterized protein n=1 Tax=Petrolisthes cinctipes TaxID=88211 RepID=A0AAE1G317_PETCI|nr:hypothetical protein Pcinc_010449 [Petrolisthes cinctipes]
MVRERDRPTGYLLNLMHLNEPQSVQTARTPVTTGYPYSLYPLSRQTDRKAGQDIHTCAGPEDTVTTQHTHSLTSAPIVTTCLFVQSTVSAVKSEES